MRTRIFIADHLGRDRLASELFQPVHIGAALSGIGSAVAERDDGYAGSLSALESYADLRCLHHVRRMHSDDLDIIGIQQYRRVFHFPPQEDSGSDAVLRDVDYACHLRSGYELHLRPQVFEAVLRGLVSLDESRVGKLLDGCDMVVNRRHDLGEETLESQYLRTISATYPGDMRYLDAWWDLKQVLSEMLPGADIDLYCDEPTGYFNNVIIARRAEFNAYCDFLFAVLARLDRWAGVYRLFGYLGERIFTLYVKHQFATRPGFRLRELPVLVETHHSDIVYPRTMRSRYGTAYGDETASVRLLPLPGATRVRTTSGRTLATAEILQSAMDSPALSISYDGVEPAVIHLRFWSAYPNGDLEVDIRSHADQHCVRLLPSCHQIAVGLCVTSDARFDVRFRFRAPGTDLSDGGQGSQNRQMVGIDNLRIVRQSDLPADRRVATLKNFDPDTYLAVNPDLGRAADADPDFDPRLHFRRYGFAEGRVQAAPRRACPPT
jgi:hypothetical protein